MGRGLPGLAVAVVLLTVSCDSGGADTAPVSEPRVQLPDLIPTDVKLPRVDIPLHAKAVQRCLHSDWHRPGPSDFAGYTGPVDWVEGQVEQERELELTTPVETKLLPPKKFDEVVARTNGEEDREESRVTRSLAWALGVTPHGIDVNFFLQGDGAELIAGFYLPGSDKLYVRKEKRLDDELVVLAHELGHAVTDQALGLPKSGGWSMVDDARLAAKSVVEGDASLIELRFLSQYISPKKARKTIKPHITYEGEFQAERRAGVPHFMIDRFMFPYQWGLAFVCSIYKARGWKGVNELYEDPPKTTAEIMFPERYLRGQKAEKPKPLGDLPAPWELTRSRPLGAFHLKTLFEAPGDLGRRTLDRPVARAASWAGGRLELWDNEDEETAAVGLSLVEHRDTPDLLCASIHEWYQAAFLEAEPEATEEGVVYRDENQKALISCEGRDVRVAIAPTIDLATALHD